MLKSKSLIHKNPCFLFSLFFSFYGPNWQLWVVEVFVLVQKFHNQGFENVHFLCKFRTEKSVNLSNLSSVSFMIHHIFSNGVVQTHLLRETMSVRKLFTKRYNSGSLRKQKVALTICITKSLMMSQNGW